MNYQNLIIFKSKTLFNILNELEDFIVFKVYEASDEKILNETIKKLDNYIILTSKNIKKNSRQIVLDKLPMKFLKLIEKINIEFLKFQYSKKSEFKVGKYKINLNSRELIDQDKVLKLTEKETKIITYLLKINKPVSINELQSEVWGYHSDLETHTVETHVYRLREKVLKNFQNKNFILSEKKGYKINL
tara:strand:- start:969 stop:1535 length:567 start_codon:yes stop_codon:yes gene_type:complete